MRQGDLVAALHIMCYLKLRHKFRLALDQSFPNIHHSKFLECDRQISVRVQWKLSHLMLHHQRGSQVDLQMKVGSDHAGNKQTRRSRTRFVICTYISLIIAILWINLPWKHQKLVQSLWPWKFMWKPCIPSDTSWGWWAFHFWEPHLFMYITWWLFITPQIQS